MQHIVRQALVNLGVLIVICGTGTVALAQETTWLGYLVVGIQDKGQTTPTVDVKAQEVPIQIGVRQGDKHLYWRVEPQAGTTAKVSTDWFPGAPVVSVPYTGRPLSQCAQGQCPQSRVLAGIQLGLADDGTLRWRRDGNEAVFAEPQWLGRLAAGEPDLAEPDNLKKMQIVPWPYKVGLQDTAKGKGLVIVEPIP